MAVLCREFGISRKTGHKTFDRYQACGLHGLADCSRRPYRYANQLPEQVEQYILTVKRERQLGSAEDSRARDALDIWLVSLMDYDLGYFDLETRVLEPLDNPFGPKVLPMS
jgi:hypothetical protein